jgi:hypothetical protein
MYRVFAANEVDLPPATVLEFLHTLDPQASGNFRGDEEGWFEAEFKLPEFETTLRLERFLATEDGIRAELNTWAAWLETKEQNPHVGRLMQQMIGTKQVFTLREEGEQAGEACAEVCRFLARQSEGVYQVDGQGYFDAAGLLLVPEDV